MNPGKRVKAKVTHAFFHCDSMDTANRSLNCNSGISLSACLLVMSVDPLCNHSSFLHPSVQSPIYSL